MQYVSTRGEAPELGFEDVLLTGLARDGGLYVPKSWPQISADELRGLRGRSYQDVAYPRGFEIHRQRHSRSRTEADDCRGLCNLRPSRRDALEAARRQSMAARTFPRADARLQGCGHAVAGPPDGLVAGKKRGSHATIVGATSGDTGGAAIDAFKNSRNATTIILHPHGRVSDVQRRQMTTVDSPAIHNIAIEGNFDDCQAISKPCSTTTLSATAWALPA